MTISTQTKGVPPESHQVIFVGRAESVCCPWCISQNGLVQTGFWNFERARNSQNFGDPPFPPDCAILAWTKGGIYKSFPGVSKLWVWLQRCWGEESWEKCSLVPKSASMLGSVLIWGSSSTTLAVLVMILKLLARGLMVTLQTCVQEE